MAVFFYAVAGFAALAGLQEGCKKDFVRSIAFFAVALIFAAIGSATS